jgi:hypothetical protein
LSQCASKHRIAGDYFALVHGQLTINDTTSCLVNRWDESALKIDRNPALKRWAIIGLANAL